MKGPKEGELAWGLQQRLAAEGNAEYADILQINWSDVHLDDGVPALSIAHIWGDNMITLQVPDYNEEGALVGFTQRQLSVDSAIGFAQALLQALDLRFLGESAEG